MNKAELREAIELADTINNEGSRLEAKVNAVAAFVQEQRGGGGKGLEEAEVKALVAEALAEHEARIERIEAALVELTGCIETLEAAHVEVPAAEEPSE